MGIKQRNKKKEAGGHREMNSKASVGPAWAGSGAVLCSRPGIYNWEQSHRLEGWEGTAEVSADVAQMA